MRATVSLTERHFITFFSKWLAKNNTHRFETKQRVCAIYRSANAELSVVKAYSICRLLGPNESVCVRAALEANHASVITGTQYLCRHHTRVIKQPVTLLNALQFYVVHRFIKLR